MIPKIIMQTYINNNLPNDWKESQNSIKIYMKNWKYVFLTDADNLKFVEKHFPDYVLWFKSLKFPIQRADVIRYMWLYINGGLYIDMDIELKIPIDILFQNGETFLVKAPRNLMNHYTNFLMASKPLNKFWLLVLEECRKPLEFWVVLPHHIVSQQTGISCLNRAIKRWEEPITELPYNFLVPCDYCSSSNLCSRPFYYTKFLKGQSWNKLDTAFFNYLSCNFDLLIVLCSIILLYKMLQK